MKWMKPVFETYFLRGNEGGGGQNNAEIILGGVVT